MTTIGLEKWGQNTYRIAVSGNLSSTGIPLIEIYDAQETDVVQPKFMFGYRYWIFSPKTR